MQVFPFWRCAAGFLDYAAVIHEQKDEVSGSYARVGGVMFTGLHSE